jgi:hypothetical protein
MEPFATLVAIGQKRIETRSWKTNYRGRIAIHASKNINKDEKQYCLKPEYMSILKGKYVIIGNDKVKYNFKFGHIIAICDLVDCVKMTELHENYAVLDNGMKVTGNELLFGDYTPGRYAWILDNVRILDNPVPAKGQLGLWNCENL